MKRKRSDVELFRLPLGSVMEAALAAGLPRDGIEVRRFAGRAHKVELVSPWGWQLAYPFKVGKAREIAYALQRAGYVCAFDVLETGGFDCIFELIP